MKESFDQELPPPIVVRGAREHNLKNVSLDIPSQQLVVITGPSGSGKSSLAFDTIFAEGQRRYIESLSAYARQFMEQLAKPDADLIDGLSPAIAIEQRTISNHPRSTVGTVTGIYDFLRLLYARLGDVVDPKTGSELKSHDVSDVIGIINNYLSSTKVQIFAAVVRGRKGEFLREFEQWRRAGFSKIRVDGKMLDLHDPILLSKHQNHDIDILLDTLGSAKSDTPERIAEALRLADKLSEGWVKLMMPAIGEEKLISKRKSTGANSGPLDLEPRLFSFNSPYGMCLKCKGSGITEAIIAESSLGEDDDDSSIETLDDEEAFFEVCTACKGARLRPEALAVVFGGLNIASLSRLSARELSVWLKNLSSETRSHPVAERLLEEIERRLDFLENVGVSYLSLDRRTGSLSGGEAQRMRLATQLGSQLSGVLYVLDEPSIGLHPADHAKLLTSLKKLRDLGNSVLVVEHDEETMLAADHLIDIGPSAGKNGGFVVAQGSPKEFLKLDSKTASFLNGKTLVTEQRIRRLPQKRRLEIQGCSGHNLKKVDLSLPLGTLIVFTGVSGSGKSSLVRETLEATLLKKLYRTKRDPLPYEKISGVDLVDKVVHVDQRPIGRSPRSNPATYTGILSLLRQLFAQLPDAQIRGYTPGTFSFNKKGLKSGRCDGCEGAGRIRLEMHFLSDVFVTCETCQGSRYRREVLEVRYKGKNIADVLSMSIEEAHALLVNQSQIEPKLRTLVDVGLGYISLGQSSTTLSGGEAQRIKLARELSKRSTGKTLYFLDEPTTGLHFEDIRRLLEVLHRLVDAGNTVVVIEHNLDVVAAADWVVDLGPGSGVDGGKIIFEGSPEELTAKTGGSTGLYLRDYFKRRGWNSQTVLPAK